MPTYLSLYLKFSTWPSWYVTFFIYCNDMYLYIENVRCNTLLGLYLNNKNNSIIIWFKPSIKVRLVL